jgi:glutathione-independent formaldehyde dehydrogenase
MRAVVLRATSQISVEEIEDPKIEHATDCIVRITSSAICGSDLHMYEGRAPVEWGTVMGHENLGIIEEVGDAVVSFRKGDRVVLPFNVSCGFCQNCSRGDYNFCLVANLVGTHAAYGTSGMGPFRGGQAELLRVPFADVNCLKLPGAPGDDLEDDFVLLADIFPTAFYATELANVHAGSSVAVFGAGPVGLLSAYCSILRGASEVFVVDCIPDRLRKAEQIGAIAIDFKKGDPVEQIYAAHLRNRLFMGALRAGEEKVLGVTCGIDAVGFQARNFSDPGFEEPNGVLESLARVVNPTGSVGVVGAYMPRDPGAKTSAAQQGRFELPWGKLWEKGIKVGSGQCPVKRYNTRLRDLIIAGRAKPSFIVSHRLPLQEAPLAYEHFDRREGGYTKVVLKPQMSPDQAAASP